MSPPSVSRRSALAAIAGITGGIAGCAGFSFGTTNEQTPVTRTPGPFDVSRDATDWTLPNYDPGHTRTAPAAAAPETLETIDWHRPASTESPTVSGLVATDTHVTLVQQRRDDGRSEYRPLVIRVLDASTGERRWQATQSHWGGGFSYDNGPLPVQYGDWLLVGYTPADATGDRVTAFSAGDGTRQWAVPVHAPSAQLPLPAAGLIHLRRPVNNGETYEVVAYDPVSGRPVWTHTFEGVFPDGPAAVADRLYYPVTASEAGREHHQVVVMDARSGEEQDRIDAEVQSYPMVTDDRLFTAGWAEGRIAAINLQRGTEDWTRSVTVQFDVPGESGRVVNARYVFGGITDDRLVVLQHFHGMRSDRVWGLDPTDGRRRWEVRPPDAPDLPVTTFYQPIVAGERVYVAGLQTQEYDKEADIVRGELRAFEISDGTEVATQELPAPPEAPPVVAEGRMYVACTDGVRAIG